MLRQVNLAGVLKAGVIGTVVMTIVMYGLPPLMALPSMDVMAALGSVFPFKISPYILGSLVHFGNGIILAFIYAAFFFGWLPGPRWLRGALFSLLPWLFAITLLGPSLQFASQLFGATPSPSAANPCSPQKANPCAAQAENPCAAKQTSAANPCAAKAANPCGAASANPCAPEAPSKGGIPPQVLSLMVHLIYGGVIGALYRPLAQLIG